MKNDLTVVVCNYNTPKETINLLKSIKKECSIIPKLVLMNTGNIEDAKLPFEMDNIPYYNFRNSVHGEGVNLALKKAKTQYVLLVDSDVIFLQDYQKPFDKFKESGCALMGKVVGDCGGKKLHPRVEPWYCFIDLYQLKMNRIDFFDKERTRKSKEENYRIYDIGSTMFEDVQKAAGGMKIADVDLEEKYFRHYGGMSWRVQSYNPEEPDTDIDFGGTHPNKQLYDIGMMTRTKYEKETSYLKDININSVFSNV